MDSPLIYASGFSPWKKPLVRRFLAPARVRFVRRLDDVPPGETIAVWGLTPVPAGRKVLRLEDGFLRSVGLGADLIRPLSWVVDGRGLYYDSSRPSDLEWLLQHSAFPAPLTERAARLRERIVAHGLTKYNVGSGSWKRPVTTGRVILVPGQVETDAAIRHGAPGVRTNIGLLQAVRANCPADHLVYKPHPDVLAGLRAQGRGEEEAGQWCDEIVTDVPIHELLEQVDEVHVLTSLAGFEALLRGKPVTTYGQPFYAGWGLTRDIEPVSRRTRRLSLDELVAGALILYPRYASASTGKAITPEQALDELLAWRHRETPGVPLWRKMLRSLLRITVGRR
ncbi:MAG TPA: beta-3-deoxy-D-manno-oct-2-ulosonic acid transferase [Burkholderiaceae bacterium]|nr:beta-3-deoxy-D-manno-oct-2-ulosonic acid transferase [Burkholderiaceae bacterium]